MSSWWLVHRLYLTSSLIWWSFLIMLHLSMRSWIHTWSCVWIDSSARWLSLWLHLRLTAILLLCLLLLFCYSSLGLQNSIDSLYKISCFRNCRACRGRSSWRWLLHMWNRIKMLWLPSFWHLIIVLMSLLLLLQKSYWLRLSRYRRNWNFTSFSFNLETLRILLQRFYLLVLRAIYLLKYWVFDATKTKTAI